MKMMLNKKALPLLGSLILAASLSQAAEVDYEPDQDSTVDPILGEADTSRQFMEDSELILRPRSYYLNRNRDTNPDTAGWALGGELAWKSGWWQESVRLAATLHTSQKLYGPADKDGTLLFKPGPDAITVLGEANLTWRWAEDAGVRIGRQRFELPYLGSHDIRMIPNTFEAIAAGNTSTTGLAWMGGYVDRIKRKNDDDFISMSEAAGVAGGDDGTVFLGARHASDNLYAGAVFQRTVDAFDTLFLKAEGMLAEEERYGLKGFFQFTDQRSRGDELIGDFDTYLISTKLELTTGDTTWKLGASRTDDELGIQKPFGNPANYLSIIVEDFDRAGEDAWMVGLSHKFGRIGHGDLSGFATIVSGDTPDSGANASADQSEYDLTVDYRIREGRAENLWLRVRGAWVDQDDDFPGANDFFDFRIIANYEFDLLRRREP